LGGSPSKLWRTCDDPTYDGVAAHFGRAFCEGRVTKSVHKITAVAFSEMSPSQKRDAIRAAAVDAVQQSIVNGNATSANQLLGLVHLFTKRRDAKVSLIAYLEKWGNIYRRKGTDDLRFHKREPAASWTKEYEALVVQDDWTEATTSSDRPRVRDAEDELRKLVNSLKKVESDHLVHPELLAKVDEAILAYGRSDLSDRERERVRGKTLFDISIRRKTMRAGKYAK